MKKLKLLIVIACTLSVGWLKGQIIDIDAMKYGCSNRSDMVTNNSLTYEITKGAEYAFK